MTTQIQLLRASSSALAILNPVLAFGEMGYETDTLHCKYGDGVTPWNSLPYDFALRDGTVIGNILQWNGVKWVSASDISPTNITINGRYTEKVTPVSISTNTLTIDLSVGNLFTCNLNQNITTLTISNAPATANTSIGFTLIFTGTGTPYTITWPGSIKWANGISPTITSTNNKMDVFSFISTNNGISWLGFTGGNNY